MMAMVAKGLGRGKTVGMAGWVWVDRFFLKEQLRESLRNNQVWPDC